MKMRHQQELETKMRLEKEARDRMSMPAPSTLPVPLGSEVAAAAALPVGSRLLPFGESDGKRSQAVLAPTPQNFGLYTPNPRSKKSSRGGEDADSVMSDPELAGGNRLGSPPKNEVPSGNVEVPSSEALPSGASGSHGSG